MSEQIEPCPNPECCNGVVAVFNYGDYFCQCNKCCSRGPSSPSAFGATNKWNWFVRAVREAQEQRERAEKAEAERDAAVCMLAAWCVDVDQNGTGWDDWDENYKDAMYREGPLRELLDKEIERIKTKRQDWNSTQ